jgi:hypothetical protein
MDWKARVRSAFTASPRVPDADVFEELAQHARATYETARADGCSHDEADRRIADLLDRSRLDAAWPDSGRRIQQPTSWSRYCSSASPSRRATSRPPGGEGR